MSRLQSLLLSPLKLRPAFKVNLPTIVLTLAIFASIAVLFYLIKNKSAYDWLYWLHDEVYLRFKGYFYYLLFPFSLVVLVYIAIAFFSLLPSYWSNGSLYRLLHKKVTQWAVDSLISLHHNRVLDQINQSRLYRLLTHKIDLNKANVDRLMMLDSFLRYQRKRRFNVLLTQPRDLTDPINCLELTFITGLTLRLRLGDDNTQIRWLEGLYLWTKTFAIVQTKIMHINKQSTQSLCLSHLKFGLDNLIQNRPASVAITADNADDGKNYWQHLFDDTQTLFTYFKQAVTTTLPIKGAIQAKMAWQQAQRIYFLEQIVAQGDQRFETFRTKQFDNSRNGLADIFPNLTLNEQCFYLHICAYYDIALSQFLGAANYDNRMLNAMESLHLLSQCQLLFDDDNTLIKNLHLLPTAGLYHLSADLHMQRRQTQLTAWETAQFPRAPIKAHHFEVDVNQTANLSLAGLPTSEAIPSSEKTNRGK